MHFQENFLTADKTTANNIHDNSRRLPVAVRSVRTDDSRRLIWSIRSARTDVSRCLPVPKRAPRRKDTILIKFGKPVLHKTFALALAAAMAVTAAGCSGTAHTSSAPSDAPQAATEAAAVPAAPSADTDAAKDADTSAAAEIAAPEDTTAATTAAAEADTAAAASTAAETADSSDTSSETAAADATSSTAETAAADPKDTAEDSAAEAMKDGVPGRDKADTALKESVLSEALVECTGWGQSAGSSLRAATASVMLLQWANTADAANADPTLLTNTVKDEVNRLSDAQKENLKANWSSISFDASMILDSFDEVSMVLEDAGCADAAKEISGNKQSVANWEALEHALDAVLK